MASYIKVNYKLDVGTVHCVSLPLENVSCDKWCENCTGNRLDDMYGHQCDDCRGQIVPWEIDVFLCPCLLRYYEEHGCNELRGILFKDVEEEGDLSFCDDICQCGWLKFHFYETDEEYREDMRMTDNEPIVKDYRRQKRA